MGIFLSYSKRNLEEENKPCKIITFLRHAESEWNAARWSLAYILTCSYPNIEDPNLTMRGRAQVDALKATMGDTVEWLKQKNIELIVVSPYRRALQTAQSLFPIEQVKLAGIKVFVTEFHGEIAHTSSDIGSSLDKLKVEFTDFDFGNIEKNIWWYNTGHEPRDNWQCRMKEFKKLMLNRDESRILVVGHSQWIMRFTGESMLRNCQMREYKLPIEYSPPQASSIKNILHE